MLGPAFFLAGNSFPHDSYIEAALRLRIGSAFSSWTGQNEMLGDAGVQEGWTSIPTRLAQLDQAMQACPVARNAVWFGRSSGARVATMYARQRGSGAVVCLGYPFRVPGKALEPRRVAHLAHVAAPVLILQGRADEYGGENIATDYVLSPSVTVKILETDHNLRLSAPEWDIVGQTILEFCQQAIATFVDEDQHSTASTSAQQTWPTPAAAG